MAQIRLHASLTSLIRLSVATSSGVFGVISGVLSRSFDWMCMLTAQIQRHQKTNVVRKLKQTNMKIVRNIWMFCMFDMYHHIHDYTHDTMGEDNTSV